MLIDLRTEGLNIYFLCPFIGCFCLIGASFASGQSIFGKFPFLQNILVSVSEILALLPYLISKKIQNDSFMKIEKSKEKENIEKNELMFDEYEEKNSQIQLYQPAILGFGSKFFILHSAFFTLNADGETAAVESDAFAFNKTA